MKIAKKTQTNNCKGYIGTHPCLYWGLGVSIAS